ncbi:hypothetical protein BN77_4124 [Rhizobium mesoamericanum STM3625]|uniref:Uncharacterized protein n=1 Tax=Rhizobium mesoamericanum STM3625 TaxID=1211777 RepID=K0Q358_9HYPH|nr:hypothetical protein BN77_4124 [Rhizobium mesoamericanum STM3625]
MEETFLEFHQRSLATMVVTHCQNKAMALATDVASESRFLQAAPPAEIHGPATGAAGWRADRSPHCSHAAISSW